MHIKENFQKAMDTGCLPLWGEGGPRSGGWGVPQNLKHPYKHPFTELNNGWLHLIKNNPKTKPRYTEVFAKLSSESGLQIIISEELNDLPIFGA